jgi:glycerol-3-phosphate acyltransferase PlsX
MAENLFQTIREELKEMEPAVTAKLGPALANLQRRHDSAEYGGAPLLGVDGIVIICHGNSRARAVANAFRAAANYARTQVNREIVETVAKMKEGGE